MNTDFLEGTVVRREANIMCLRLILSFLELPRRHPDEMLEALVQDTPGWAAFAYARTIHVRLPGGSGGIHRCREEGGPEVRKMP